MKKRKTVNPAVGWVVLIAVLALFLLSIFKPELVGSVLKIVGSGKFSLASLTENFRISMDDVITGLVLPKDTDPNVITLVKSLGVDIVGIVATYLLGSIISDRMYVSFPTGVLYAYLPCTAAVFIVNGIGISNTYLLISLIFLCLTMLFSRRGS